MLLSKCQMNVVEKCGRRRYEFASVCKKERERRNVMTRAECWLIGFKHITSSFGGFAWECECEGGGGGRDKWNNLKVEKKDWKAIRETSDYSDHCLYEDVTKKQQHTFNILVHLLSPYPVIESDEFSSRPISFYVAYIRFGEYAIKLMVQQKHTVCFTDLDQGSVTIIFESI